MQVPSYILKHTKIKDEKIWHFYMLLALWNCIYVTINVSVVLFLNEQLGNIFLAGLALSIGALFSLLFDGLFSYLQKIFPARTLFLSSIIGVLFAMMFFLFPYPFFAYLAAIFFRISFDLCDITAISYILSKSLPAEYGENLSYKQLAQGIGLGAGFIISALLMKVSYFIGATGETLQELIISSQGTFFSTLFVLKILIIFLLFFLWFFAFLLFDKSVPNFSKEFLQVSFQKLEAETIEGLKQTSTQILKNLKEKSIPKEQNQIELTPLSHTEKFNVSEMTKELSSAFKKVFQIFSKWQENFSLAWSTGVMGFFSYWDTFLATFIPIFFTEILRNQPGFIQGIPGSLLMLLFILPVMGFLPLIAKLGDKYGRYYFMLLGVFMTILSGFSIVLFYDTNFFIILLSGFGIALGYLFGMSSAKAQSASKMNEFFAIEGKTRDIESNIAAGPIMVIDNIGNIFGPLLGGALIEIFGFRGFFFVLTLVLFLFFIVSIKNFSLISGHSYVLQSPILIKKQ
jgi:MFS family permease